MHFPTQCPNLATMPTSAGAESYFITIFWSNESVIQPVCVPSRCNLCYLQLNNDKLWYIQTWILTVYFVIWLYYVDFSAEWEWAGAKEFVCFFSLIEFFSKSWVIKWLFKKISWHNALTASTKANIINNQLTVGLFIKVYELLIKIIYFSVGFHTHWQKNAVVQEPSMEPNF